MKTILCLGDSNTYGYDPSGFFGGRYEAPWPALLSASTGWTVRNLGQNGQEIPASVWETEELDRQIRALLPADLLLILLGTNDLLNIYRPTAGILTARMEEYLLHLRGEFPSLPLLLLAPPPIRIPAPELCRLARALGPAYRELAGRLGADFADPGSWDLPLAFDGVHLTQEGHRIFAQKIEDVLRSLDRS